MFAQVMPTPTDLENLKFFGGLITLLCFAFYGAWKVLEQLDAWLAHRSAARTFEATRRARALQAIADGDRRRS